MSTHRDLSFNCGCPVLITILLKPRDQQRLIQNTVTVQPVFNKNYYCPKNRESTVADVKKQLAQDLKIEERYIILFKENDNHEAREIGDNQNLKYYDTIYYSITMKSTQDLIDALATMN